MTWVRWAVGLLLLAGLAWGVVDELSDSAEVSRLRAANARLTDAYASASARADSTLQRERARSDSLLSVQAGADTVFRRTAKTLKVEVADRLRPHVRALIHADSVKVAACEGRIASCERKLSAFESELASADPLLAVRDTLIGELDTGFFDALWDAIGFGGTCGLTTDGKPGCAVGVGVSF